jgi:hypothetical protein
MSLVAIGLTLASAAAADDLLPVKRGRYAPAGAPCAAGDVINYDGDTLSRTGLRNCRTSAAKAGSLTYKVTEICHGDTGDTVRDTTYRLTGQSGFHILDPATGPGVEYRLCAPPAEPDLIRGFTP